MESEKCLALVRFGQLPQILLTSSGKRLNHRATFCLNMKKRSEISEAYQSARILAPTVHAHPIITYL